MSLTCRGHGGRGAGSPFDMEVGSSPTESGMSAIGGEKPSPLIDLEEDTFSLTISQLVRDWQSASDKANKGTLKLPWGVLISRFVVTLVLLFATLFLQIFLLSQVKKFVSAKAVHDLRDVYDAFEIHMYGDDLSHMTVTPNGKHRGIAEYFNASLFDTLPEETKSGACRVPLSQPYFFATILFVWTVTCCRELKKCIMRFRCLVLRTTTVNSMKSCFEGEYKETAISEGGEDCKVIHNLTLSIKCFFVVVLFVPRVGITGYLLWLGCRWLLATNDFAALILNAVALEFILNLKEILYASLAPHRDIIDCENTKMLPEHPTMKANGKQLREVSSWLCIASLWVWLYMCHLQMVVPDYRWDVHNVCVDWIKVRYAV